MNRYRMTSPRGHSTTCDMNDAAVEQFAGTYAAAGWSLELLGPSLITIVSEEEK